MGAQLVYAARTLCWWPTARANRIRDPFAAYGCHAGNPHFYGQRYAAQGGELIYVLDRVAAEGLLAAPKELKSRGIVIKNIV
jgi:glucosamine-6-phosphate deaminase